jgi:hypothetical protein
MTTEHTELKFHRFSSHAPNAIDFTPKALVIAGWTGRDKDKVEHHIQELEALGVKRPSATPVYYRVAAGRLTQDTKVQVLGADSSGEVEPVLFSMRDGLFLGVGSDHTDRKLETVGVALSKQICPKVVSGTLWDCREIAEHWDQLVVRSYITENARSKRVLYQQGKLGELLSPQTLLEGYAKRENLKDTQGMPILGLPIGTVMFCGTFGAMGGVRGAVKFQMEIEDPVKKRWLTHSYDIEALPVVE